MSFERRKINRREIKNKHKNKINELKQEIQNKNVKIEHLELAIKTKEDEAEILLAGK